MAVPTAIFEYCGHCDVQSTFFLHPATFSSLFFLLFLSSFFPPFFLSSPLPPFLSRSFVAIDRHSMSIFCSFTSFSSSFPSSSSTFFVFQSSDGTFLTLITTTTTATTNSPTITCHYSITCLLLTRQPVRDTNILLANHQPTPPLLSLSLSLESPATRLPHLRLPTAQLSNKFFFFRCTRSPTDDLHTHSTQSFFLYLLFFFTSSSVCLHTTCPAPLEIKHFCSPRRGRWCGCRWSRW